MMDTAAYCETLVREADRDRFLAALFAPADLRRHLFALAAFNIEVSRIREAITQPAAGEIRLQWWREVIEGKRAEEGSAHPVAMALLVAIRECRLPVAAFDRLLEAHILDLYDDPLPAIGDLEGYAGDTQSALVRLGSIVLARGAEPPGVDAAGHGGVAWAMTGLMRSFGLHASQGRIFLPVDLMARHGVNRDDVLSGRMTPAISGALNELGSLARGHYETSWAGVRELPADLRPAFLPIALVPLYLKRMTRPGFDPFRERTDVAQWRRQITLWRASRG